MAAAVSHRILRRVFRRHARGNHAIAPCQCVSQPDRWAARGRSPGHDRPEGQSRLGVLTAPEGEVQRETGLSRCLALDWAEAVPSCGPTQEPGSARESMRRDVAPWPKPRGATSPPRGAAEAEPRGKAPGARADRSQRSPRDSSVTARAFLPPERESDPECRLDRRRSGDRRGGVERVPTKAGVARRASFGPRANEVRATVDPGERRSAVLDPTGVGSRALRGERACRPPTRRCTRQVACRRGH